MGLFSKLFKKNKNTDNIKISKDIHNQVSNDKEKVIVSTDNDLLDSFSKDYNNLLSLDKFLSRSEFTFLKEKYKDLFIKYKSINDLDKYCLDFEINLELAKDFLKNYDDLNNDYILIKNHNNQYIENHLKTEREYFDNILKDVDSTVILDEEQRIVCLDDEDYSLIIAGAGAGKTTTLAAKVKYLIDKKGIDPKDILIIAFTNKAVNELKDKIVKKLGYAVPISTFHSCGRAIVKKDVNYADTGICSENFYYIKDYISKLVEDDQELLSDLIMLFAYYLDLTEDITNNISLEDHFSLIETSDFSTLKHNIQNYINENLKTNQTIKNEILRSNEEVQIANFLFMNNIEYEYEKPYKYPIPNANKIYTPDFFLKQGENECYIEHFGITEDGRNNRYTKEELDNYIVNMNYKIYHHKVHNTKLITTFSKYNDGRTLLEHLEEELIKNGFILEKKDDKEIYAAITKNKDNKYIFKFCNIASRFISLFKTKNYNDTDFEVLKRKTNNPRNILFLSIMEKVYLAYQLYLKENKLVDFEDMINESARLLKEVSAVRDKINFKYILIDEYQDISRARLNLVNEIKNATNAKISVVGDDWQAIYGYAGSEVNLFTKFKEEMGYASVLKITRTYRNAQEVIDIAGGFVQKNDAQIKKQLISNKHIVKPINIYTYDGRYKSKDNPGYQINRAKLLEETIGKIYEYDKKHNIESNILIIGRYNFDGNHLIKTGLFYTTEELVKKDRLISKKYPNAKLTFMTAHKTKGLTFDNVILINAVNGRYGFPSQIEDDPIFNFVRTKDDTYDFSEERRLFYVSLTRTKNRVFILTPDNNPSVFVLELLNDYPDKVNLRDNDFPLRREVVLLSKNRAKCPVCGYPLQLQKNDNYGLRLFICTNEPEVCDYMTNNLISGKKSIHLCSKCGGVMYIKKQRDKNIYFFGCSNFKNDYSGCNNIEQIDSKE